MLDMVIALITTVVCSFLVYRNLGKPTLTGIDDENIETACAALNRGVERCVELAFAQYQWTYKRFPD